MEKRDIRNSIREISKHVFKPPAQRLVTQKMEIDSVPSQETIAGRAYEIFHTRGRQNGLDQQDWFSAERELGLKN